MPRGGRKIAFSGKKKREQLIAKRQRKSAKSTTKSSYTESNSNQDEASIVETTLRQPKRNRYALQFFEDSQKNIELIKHTARQPIKMLKLEDREAQENFFENYDFPVRPPWNYTMSKEEEERNETQYFNDYLKSLMESHNEVKKSLSLFELNLETWRQLWRVLEMSDIILIIVDVRYSALMFPPSLYDYIKSQLGKNAVLILNKIDLVKAEIVVAWKQYFLDNYPGLQVVIFASYYSRIGRMLSNKKPMVRANQDYVMQLFKCVNNIVESDLDLSGWRDKILMDQDQDEMGVIDEASSTEKIIKEESFQPEIHTKYKNGIVTIGCVGFPNVGKSSVINALKGRKVVSVSRTPGRTKYFQTIFLTENVKLCDCPGLVFPSSTPKNIQVILGSFPIAQLRQPYPAIRFVAERVDLSDLLSLSLPSDYKEWSPVAICEAWAIKRGFLTAKAARPDIHRAANNILQLVLQGKISCEFLPVGFLEKEDYWKSHPDIATVRNIFTPPVPDDTSTEHNDGTDVSESEDTNNSSQESMNTYESDSSDRPKNCFSLLGDD